MIVIAMTMIGRGTLTSAGQKSPSKAEQGTYDKATFAERI